MADARYMPMFDSVEDAGAAPAKGRRSLREWVKENPKKTVLFACLIALGIVLIVFLGLVLALLPVMRSSVEPATLTVRLANLCSSSSSYSVSASILNPSTVAVEVTRQFTVTLSRAGAAVAEVDVEAFVLKSGRTPLNMTSQWRVLNTTAAGLLLGDVLGNATNARATLSMHLPVRVYGGLALTLPLSFDLDLTSPPPTAATPASAGINASVTDMGASADAASLQVNAAAQVASVPVVEADVPRINLVVTDAAAQTIGNITFEPFSIRNNVPFALQASFLSQLAFLPQLQLAVKNFGAGSIVRGAPDDSCMIRQVLQNMRYVVPATTTATATRAATTSSSSSSSFFPLRLAAASIVVAQEATASVTLTGVNIVEPLPPLSLGVAGMGRINLAGGMGGVVTAQAVPDEAAVASAIQKLSAPAMYVTGVDDPAANLLSRALALLNYTIPPSTAPSAPFSVAIGPADPSSLTCTASLREVLTVQGTMVALSVSPTAVVVTSGAEVGRVTVSVGPQNSLSLVLSVSDFAGARGVLQPALNNATSSVTVTGDPANGSVLGRILKRVQRVQDLRALVNDAPAASVPSPRKPTVTLASMQATALTLTADLSSINLTGITGALPVVSLDLAYQTNAMATVQLSAQLPQSAALAGIVNPGLCAQFITDALNAGKSPGIIAVRGSASTATSNVLQRLVDGLSYRVDSPSAPGSQAAVSLSALALQGDSGSINGQPANIVLDLLLSYTVSNAFFRGDFPAISAGLRVGSGEAAVVTVPALSFVPNAPLPPQVTVSVLVSGPAKLSDGVTQVLGSKAVSIAVRGPDGAPPSTNVLQSIINALPYQYTLQAPSGATTGVLPAIKSQYLSSSVVHLAVAVMYDFTLNTTMEIRHGDAALAAVYQGNQIATVALDQTKPFAQKLVGGKNTLGATVRITADTAARRTALETFASAAFQETAAPLTITGQLSSATFRFAPVRFSYDFVLPKSASGGSNSLLPCFEAGLTTPFDSSWKLGSCVPLISNCKCSGLNSLCDTGPCNSVSVTSRCVDLKLSVIIHFFVNNVLPVKLRMNHASADLLFDYAVASLSSFSNTRNTPDVLIARLDTAIAGANAILNPMPIAVALDQSTVLSAWLRNQHLAPPPAGENRPLCVGLL